jgi:hypothetical protein
MFEVRGSPSRAAGLFATAPIRCDTVIMCDPLVLRYEKDEEPQQTYRRFLRLPPLIREEILKLAVRRDSVAAIEVRVKISGRVP